MLVSLSHKIEKPDNRIVVRIETARFGWNLTTLQSGV